MPVLLIALMWRLQSVSYGALAGLVVLYSVLLHEIAHLLIARATGGDLEDVILWPLGGLLPARPGQGPWSAALVALAGPLASLLVALGCAVPLHAAGELTPLLSPFAEFTLNSTEPEFAVAREISDGPAVPASESAAAQGDRVVAFSELPRVPGKAAESWTMTVLRMTFAANFWLAAVNLLPFLPMDGGWMLRWFLAMRYSEAEVRDLVLRCGLVASLSGLLGGFIFDLSGVVALSAFVLVLHIHESLQSSPAAPLRDESFLGYDFSAGYTSLDRSLPEFSEPEESVEQDDFARTGILDRWKSRREEERLRRESAERERDEQQLDAILEKLHSQGREALNTAELHLLDRVSARFRQRNQRV